MKMYKRDIKTLEDIKILIRIKRDYQIQQRCKAADDQRYSRALEYSAAISVLVSLTDDIQALIEAATKDQDTPPQEADKVVVRKENLVHCKLYRKTELEAMKIAKGNIVY